MRQFDRHNHHDLGRENFPSRRSPERLNQNGFEQLLSRAARSISRGSGLSEDAIAAVGELFEKLGTSEQEMMALSATEIKEALRDPMAGYVGKSLGLLGKAAVRNVASHVHGMRLLAKAAELCPDDRRILLELSNAGHSVQWAFLKRALANDIGREPHELEVRRERFFEEVVGLRATHTLLSVLEMDPKQPDLRSAKQFLVGIWALSNAAHYYYTLGTIKAQGTRGVGDELREFSALSSKQCFREAIRFSRAVMDYFDVPPSVDQYFENLPPLKQHPEMRQSIPETVGGIFSISGLAYRDLGELKSAAICLRTAMDLSPLSPIFSDNYLQFLRENRLSQPTVDAWLLPSLQPQSAAASARGASTGWENVERKFNLSQTQCGDDYVGKLWRHFESAPGDAALFVQHHRSAGTIESMWGIAAEEGGLRHVTNVRELLQKLETFESARGLGVPQVIAQYDEIIAAMSVA